MFEYIDQLSTTYDSYNNITYYSFYLKDSEFGTINYTLTDNVAAYMRIIINEYSSRNLNVAYNLKLYLRSKTKYLSHNEAKLMIENNFQHLKSFYNHLQIEIEEHYPCLMNYLKRLEFVGHFAKQRHPAYAFYR